MSENTDYDKACREIARIAAALGIVDYSGDTSEIFDAIIINDEKHQALNEIKAQGVDEFVTKIARDLRMAGGGDGYHEEPYHEFADHIECKGGDFAASLRGEQNA